MIKFTIPIRTKNPLNGSQGRSRGAIMAKAARRKKERDAARLCMIAAAPSSRTSTMSGLRIERGDIVTLRRVSPRALDGDGLQAALKSIRDGIADALGINDGSDAVSWRYEHRRGKPREYAVDVEISGNQEQTREALP